MGGWEFLDAYEAIEDEVLKRPDIYLISSSIDPRDVEKSQCFKSISGFYSKPLLTEQLLEIIEAATVE